MDEDQSTMKSIESEVIQYSNSLNILPGTIEYSEYLSDQLMFQHNTRVTQAITYDEIAMYI